MATAAAALRRFVANGRNAQSAVDQLTSQHLQRQLDQDLEELERRGLARRVNESVAITAKGLEYLQKHHGRRS